MTKSWIKHARQKARQQKIKNINKKIFDLHIKQAIYWLPFITYVMIGAILCIFMIDGRMDLIIAMLSFIMMIISFYNSRNDSQTDDGYRGFFVAILGFAIGYFVLFWILEKLKAAIDISDDMMKKYPDITKEEIIDYIYGLWSRWISVGCLFITFFVETRKKFNIIQKDLKNQIELKQEELKQEDLKRQSK